MLAYFAASSGPCSTLPRLPVPAIQVLNNHALPFFAAHAVKIHRIMSDSWRCGCCGVRDIGEAECQVNTVLVHTNTLLRVVDFSQYSFLWWLFRWTQHLLKKWRDYTRKER